MPEVDSPTELHQMMERWDEEDEQRRIRSRPRTSGELFAVERPPLRSLPDEPWARALVIFRFRGESR
ncbi:hypothetical protein [Streptosporangium canum]|uniref:hypothetical protein n=1 Tax=Streptosporangium canum TaxID=324952 RepID=UPI000B819039|nr:hypothetical protein [Streptosporangium canum]